MGLGTRNELKEEIMNWKQLLAVLTLVVAMFSTAIMISVLYTISGFERLESRMDSRMDQLEDRMDSRMDQLENKMDSRIGRLETKMDRLETRMDRLESKIDQLDNKVDGLSNEVAEIKGALKAKGIMAKE